MSLGPQIRIAYRVLGIDQTRMVLIDGDGSVSGASDVAFELGLRVSGDRHVRRVVVEPTVDLTIDEVVAVMHLPLADADTLYLNGYNSWTDSVERAVDDRMWGLTRVPRRLVDTYVLDGGGDYRFVPEDSRRGHQHGFGYGYVRQGSKVLLFGSLNEDNGLTLIQEDLAASTLTFVKETPNRALTAGEARELISLAVTSGTVEEATDSWLALAGIHRRPARAVVGYSSWYRHYGNIDAWKLERDLRGIEKVLLAEDLEGLDPVFQIDDGYAKVGDWLDYDCARFPEGPRAIAAKATERGLLPGIWLAPFVCERDSRVFAQHPNWVLRGAEGEPVTTGSQWSGGVALDVRNPEVREYLGEVLRIITQEWGFKLLKLDFLYAACLVPHDGMNRGELIADALDLLRSSVVEGTRLLFCGVPLVSAFGRCEYCRIGQDVGLDWDDKPHMRLLHRERVSTKLSLANARGRAHLDGRAFRCDPDVLFLRDEGVSFTPRQYREMLETDTSCGGVLFTSDDMSAWNEDQLARFHNALELFRAHNNL